MMKQARRTFVRAAFLALMTGHVISAGEITLAELKALRTEPRKIVYKTADNVKLQVHLYAAEGRAPGEKRPAILMIHGGGWESPGPFHMAPHCRYFALRGLVAVNVEYRLAKKDSAVRIPDCVADCRDALRLVRRKAAELGIDPERIAVAGDSAGGHLAAALGLLPDPEEGEQGVVSSRPNAMILYNPVVDLAALQWMRGHAGVGPRSDSPQGETWEDRARGVSPIRYVRKGLPPTLLIHGDRDGCVPVERADRFAKLMRDAGNRIEYHRMAGWDHAFAIPGCGTDQQITEALRMTDRFLAGLGYLQGEATIVASRPHPETVRQKEH
ncbi:MAG: alpha/beta hydrolase [Thermoguttaceae bacterium]|jgi:acetyl esterase/lipase